jgi:hypothetical protein
MPEGAIDNPRSFWCLFMMVAGRTGAQAGAQGRRILFFTENAQGWNALWPIVMRLKQHADLTSSRLVVTYLATENHESWRFASKESEIFFRQFHVPADDIEVPAWDVFVISHAVRLVGVSPLQHVVAVPHGAGFGNVAYSLQKFARSTLYCGFSPAEADYIADQTGQSPPANRFIATGAPRNDRFASFLGASMAVRDENKRRLKANLALRRTSHWCWSRPIGRPAASCAHSAVGSSTPWFRLPGNAKLFKFRTPTYGMIPSSIFTIPRPNGPAKRGSHQPGFATRWTTGIRPAK